LVEKELEEFAEFYDTKGVIRIRISKKNRQHNGQMKNYKMTNNDLQNTRRRYEGMKQHKPGRNLGAPEVKPIATKFHVAIKTSVHRPLP
jgi:hypothetical protein